MSANNYILIKENKTKIKVVMCDAEEGAEMEKPVYTKTLREAIEMANGIMEEEIVEYGIKIKLLCPASS